MKLFNKVYDMLSEGVSNEVFKNELSRVLDVKPEDITVKRYSKDGAWITVKGYTRKLRAEGSNIYVGAIGFNLDSDYQMDGLREEMDRYREKENKDYEQLQLALESINESEHSYPLIDFEKATDEELQKWLDDNNDLDYYPEEFKDIWLEVYKYLQSRKKEKELVATEAELVPREAGDIDPERRKELVARLKKYWPRVPQAWIDYRTDDYIEQVVQSYEKRAEKKPALTPEELEAKKEEKKKEDFKAKLADALKNRK